MKIIKINEQGVEFDDGTKITDIHNQDCCESVYADWKQLEDTNIMERTFRKIKIEGVEDSGFKLNGFFVPCYNEQNGYYTDNLSLWITKPGEKKKVLDISDFTEYVEDS